MGKEELEIANPILITGCARSGTSMVAGIINMCGAWGGELSGPTRFNRRGMFENTRIRNDLVKPFLRDAGCDPMGQKPLPRIRRNLQGNDPILIGFGKGNRFVSVNDRLIALWYKSLLDILKSQGYKGGSWFYKGAKMCLIWPVWHGLFPKAKWIIVRRDAEDIVRSCLRTSFMRAFRKRSGWLYWVSVHEKRFEEMYEQKLDIREVWPQRMINGDFSQIQGVINALGLEWKFEEVKAFVEPKLWNRGNKNVSTSD